jgi:DNA invertase Pin-like site-specific DNA recombinase
MKIGVYIRVSTELQQQKGISIDDQRMRGIEFCEKNNYEYKVYDDGGFSGELSIDERPGLNQLFEDIYLGEINGVYVVDFDRISRDEKDGFVIKKTLLEHNIKLFDTSGEINLQDETQDLLLGIKILLSSFELKKLRVRIKRSLERSVSEGRAGGGPLINYGYRKDENKILVIDEVEAEVVKLIYQLSIEGKGTKVIANLLNENQIPTKRASSKTGYMMVKGARKTEFIWRDSVIYRILTNPLYKGIRIYKDKEYKAPQIIDVEKFDLVQQLLKTKKNYKDTTNKYFYLLKGLIYCSECNSRFYGRKRKDLSDNQYICSSQRYTGEFCGTRGINIDYLNELVINQLIQLTDDVRKFYEYYETTDQSRKNMILLKKTREEEIKLTQQIEKLLDVYTEGNIKKEFLNKKMEELNKKLDETHKAKSFYLYELGFLDKKEDVIRIIEEHINELKKATQDEIKRNIIRALVKRIKIIWEPNIKSHIINIDYKIDSLTQFQLNKKIDITYKVDGWRFSNRKIFKQDINIRKVIGQNETEPLTTISIV